MNLNKMARVITLKESKKREVNIAQIKEILKITLIELGTFPNDEIIRTIERYRK